MISEQDVQSYKRDGVIVVPEVLGEDALAKLRSVIAELVAGSAKTTEHTDVYDLEPGHTAESPRVRRIKTPHKVHALFNDIVRSEPVLDILKRLIGPGLRLHGSKLNMKSAQYGSPVEWHQDWAFYPHTNDDVLAIGVLLDDCDLANGPMLVTPGTHTARSGVITATTAASPASSIPTSSRTKSNVRCRAWDAPAACRSTMSGRCTDRR